MDTNIILNDPIEDLRMTGWQLDRIRRTKRVQKL